jgi:nucleotide-binding universal stress UspA family protein
MKNVLLLVHDDDGQEARIQAALDATRALGGHLTCVHVTEFAPVVGDAFGMSGAIAVLEVEQESESAHRAVIERRIARENVPFDFVEMTGDLDACIEEAGRLADLIVVNSEMAQLFQRGVYGLVERLVVKSDKAILSVATEWGFRPADPVLVAWDGSGPASAAVRAAVPLLKLSESVVLYEVDDGKLADEAEDAASYLSRHGIYAEIVRDRAPSTDFVEPLLLSKMESGRFGWAVMGAFSKSRLREGLFGGTTKRVLKEAPIPLLIAH